MGLGAKRAAGYGGRVLVMLSEQEKLQRDIHSLTEVIKRTWAEVRLSL
jgi:hypothetical protein